MYICRYSIYELAPFMEGYELALKSNFEEEIKDELSFMEWVEHKYCISDTAWHWSRILHHVAGDEKKALTLFFDIWPDYWEKRKNPDAIDKCKSYRAPDKSVTDEHWNEIHNEK